MELDGVFIGKIPDRDLTIEFKIDEDSITDDGYFRVKMDENELRNFIEQLQVALIKLICL